MNLSRSEINKKTARFLRSTENKKNEWFSVPFGIVCKGCRRTYLDYMKTY